MVGGFSGQGSALDVRTREIRLLVMSLEPASKSATLALTVKRVRLVDASPFYALSYVCGPDKPTRPVIVNSERVNLRLSIWNFLHTIRKYFCQPVGCSDSTIQIWADCLCIDQDNIEERNAQVSMMGDIYKAADKGRIGPRDEYLECDQRRIQRSFGRRMGDGIIMARSK
jgi:hypothetical protein